MLQSCNNVIQSFFDVTLIFQQNRSKTKEFYFKSHITSTVQDDNIWFCSKSAVRLS